RRGGARSAAVNGARPSRGKPDGPAGTAAPPPVPSGATTTVDGTPLRAVTGPVGAPAAGNTAAGSTAAPANGVSRSVPASGARRSTTWLAGGGAAMSGDGGPSGCASGVD